MHTNSEIVALGLHTEMCGLTVTEPSPQRYSADSRVGHGATAPCPSKFKLNISVTVRPRRDGLVSVRTCVDLQVENCAAILSPYGGQQGRLTCRGGGVRIAEGIIQPITDNKQPALSAFYCRPVPRWWENIEVESENVKHSWLYETSTSAFGLALRTPDERNPLPKTLKTPVGEPFVTQYRSNKGYTRFRLEEFSSARRAQILPFQQINAICVAVTGNVFGTQRIMLPRHPSHLSPHTQGHAHSKSPRTVQYGTAIDHVFQMTVPVVLAVLKTSTLLTTLR
ncbi:hypothetical protein J6590_060294 [Homalodisca vitripennis]|nr:hypothetical protein J6590_060294 [Homalodisca vitripennis]